MVTVIYCILSLSVAIGYCYIVYLIGCSYWLLLYTVSYHWVQVPPRAEEITIPGEVTPEKVPTHIVDFSGTHVDQLN